MEKEKFDIKNTVISADEARQRVNAKKEGIDVKLAYLNTEIKQAITNNVSLILINNMTDDVADILRDRGYRVYESQYEGKTVISWE